MLDWMRTSLKMLVMIACFVSLPAVAATKQEIDHGAQKSLKELYAKYPAAKSLSKDAKGILVFPSIGKAGLIIGGEGGEGVLLVNGKPDGYYSTGGLSIGLQAGAQKYGYALFLMTEDALNYLKTSSGWELGVGPNIVVVDAGAAKNLTTTTAKDDIYAFIFSQKGLMAGIGLKGNKISKIEK